MNRIWTVLVYAIALATVGAAQVVTPTTWSSGEDAYVGWDMLPTDVPNVGTYYLRMDGGPWTLLIPSAIVEAELPAGSPVRTFATNRGKLTTGAHTAEVRWCDKVATATCYDSAPGTITIVPPTDCIVSAWSAWSEWTPWVVTNSMNETRSHERWRSISTPPSPGGALCPSLSETASETRPYTPPVADPVTVAFVKQDITTQGTWKNVYGLDGAVFAVAPSTGPTYATVTPSSNIPMWTWAAQTADRRALQRFAAIDPEDRTASTWYAPGSFILDVRFKDTAVHQVAMYAIDFDRWGRSQTVEVLDSQGAILHTQTLTDMQNGVWLVWKLSGHAQIRVTRTGSQNGVASGLFFDSGLPRPVDCVLSAWGPWSAWSIWKPQADGLTETRTRGRVRSVVTQPSNGGAVCGDLSEIETESRLVLSVRSVITDASIKQCKITVSAPAPTVQTGWAAQFYRNGALLGAADATAPYERSVTVKTGTYTFTVKFTRTGSTPVTYPPSSIVCTP